MFNFSLIILYLNYQDCWWIICVYLYHVHHIICHFISASFWRQNIYEIWREMRVWLYLLKYSNTKMNYMIMTHTFMEPTLVWFEHHMVPNNCWLWRWSPHMQTHRPRQHYILSYAHYILIYVQHILLHTHKLEQNQIFLCTHAHTLGHHHTVLYLQ